MKKIIPLFATVTLLFTGAAMAKPGPNHNGGFIGDNMTQGRCVNFNSNHSNNGQMGGFKGPSMSITTVEQAKQMVKGYEAGIDDDTDTIEVEIDDDTVGSIQVEIDDAGTIQVEIDVEQAKQMGDDQKVTLKGYIIKSLGGKDYLFKDDTGTIKVEIDHKRWRGQVITPNDLVEIQGEVDKDWKSIEIDVKRIIKVNADK